eukprot:CAMPEP_0119300374 /NCGR_PEP_ID=MMETSP1333-20130426/2326_1 /TAXON_ID=418940 /ORGANISM="Scyphosphaera apsteinii, Strain RCC1455" /LENGTH=592 /DNA_ID=CAMNT_0007302121 /DNA_START=217 /DNA_END=1995 /DNA_ORIENTATION=-
MSVGNQFELPDPMLPFALLVDVFLSPKADFSIAAALHFVLDVSEVDAVSAALLTLTAAEGLDIALLRRLLADEISRNIVHPAQILRSQSLCSRALHHHARHVGRTFLHSALHDIVSELTQAADTREHGLEVDGSRACPHVFDARIREATEQVPRLRQPTDVEAIVLSNRVALEHWTRTVLAAIADASALPLPMLVLCAEMDHHAAQLELSLSQRVSITGGYLMLRWIVPSLVSPEAHGLLSAPPSKAARRALILVSKLLQAACNNATTSFGGKEAYMLPFYDFLQSITPMVAVFLRRACECHQPSAAPPENIRWRSIQPAEGAGPLPACNCASCEDAYDPKNSNKSSPPQCTIKSNVGSHNRVSTTATAAQNCITSLDSGATPIGLACCLDAARTLQHTLQRRGPALLEANVLSEEAAERLSYVLAALKDSASCAEAPTLSSRASAPAGMCGSLCLSEQTSSSVDNVSRCQPIHGWQKPLPLRLRGSHTRLQQRWDEWGCSQDPSSILAIREHLLRRLPVAFSQAAVSTLEASHGIQCPPTSARLMRRQPVPKALTSTTFDDLGHLPSPFLAVRGVGAALVPQVLHCPATVH